MKVVINADYGGFGVSIEAMKRLIAGGSKFVKVMDEREYFGGMTREESSEKYKKDGYTTLGKYKDVGDGYLASTLGSTLYKDDKVYSFEDYDIASRSCPVLVKIVEEMGEDSWGDYAHLKIINVPDSTPLLTHVSCAHCGNPRKIEDIDKSCPGCGSRDIKTRPVDFTIEDYDGVEWISEKHQTFGESADE